MPSPVAAGMIEPQSNKSAFLTLQANLKDGHLPAWKALCRLTICDRNDKIRIALRKHRALETGADEAGPQMMWRLVKKTELS